MMQAGKIFVSLFSCCIPALFTFAQEFNFTADLDTVRFTGFYSITITPDLSAFIKTDLADIRIADDKKHWVPHILQPGVAASEQDSFKAFPLIHNSITDSGKNLMIVENTNPDGINSLKLILKNSAVSRAAVLSGSNNQLEWYIIDDNLAISRSFETVKDEYVQEINFPLARYRYLKISIDNAHRDPLLITSAGFYASPTYKKSGSNQNNPLPSFTQKDSNRNSYIEVRQHNNYPFDKVVLYVNGSKFYSRDMSVCYPANDKNNIAKPGLVMGNFKLAAAMPAVFELPRTKAPVFFIVIKNADNPSLKIEKVITQQQTISLIAYLEQGKKYSLLMGDPNAPLADYDLQIFKDSITNLRPLNFSGIRAIKKDTAQKAAGKGLWIWPAIILAALALSYLTWQLTGDINKMKR